MGKMLRHPARAAMILCVIAFALRLAAVAAAPEHFWAYTVYYDIAKTLVTGGGYCLSAGFRCAYFPPVYPTVLAAGILTGNVIWGIATLGALAGAGTVWFVWLSAERLFGATRGLWAAGFTCIYPYFVWHDAVVQETGVLTLLVTATIWLLLRGDYWLISGMLLGLAVLTKANISLFAAGVLIWIAVSGSESLTLRRRRCLWTAAGFALLVCPWVARTWIVTGSPVIYSNGGFALWTAQHPRTFDYFPERSIDEASLSEEQDLSPAGRKACHSGGDPHGIRCSAWFWAEGMKYVKAAPGTAVKHGLYKIYVAFSPVFSPAKGVMFQWVYFISYFPLLLFSALGAGISRSRWRETGFIGVLIVTFAAGCAVFWGHTSHRMYLEPSLMILASGAIPRIRRNV